MDTHRDHDRRPGAPGLATPVFAGRAPASAQVSCSVLAAEGVQTAAPRPPRWRQPVTRGVACVIDVLCELLAVLERFTARSRLLWLVVAVLVLIASLGGPLAGTGAETSDRAARHADIVGATSGPTASPNRACTTAGT